MLKSKATNVNTGFAGLSLFLLLMGIYLLRGLRDEAAVSIGIDQLGWLITATFSLFCLLSIWIKMNTAGALKRFQSTTLFIALGVSLCAGFEMQVALFLLIGTGSLLLVSLFWEFSTILSKNRSPSVITHKYSPLVA